MRLGFWDWMRSLPGERVVRMRRANCRNGLHGALREAGEGALNAGRRWCLESSIEEQTVMKWGDEEGESVLQAHESWGPWTAVGPEPRVCVWWGAGTAASGANRRGTSDMEDFVCHAKKRGFYPKAKDPCEESWIWISFYRFWRFIFQKNHPGNIVEVETGSRETSNSLLEKRRESELRQRWRK